ncbi:hypothetical protein V2G26_017087 [Clonostachys chloroleuca]
MLRRNSSRKNLDRSLGRSKSTSAIYQHSVRDLSKLDPVIAERDAHIAARLSYYRAQGRFSEGMASNSQAFPLPRSGSSVSRHSLCRSESQRSRLSGTHGIKRQQSIRFAGRNGHRNGDIAPRASEQHLSAAYYQSSSPLNHEKTHGYHSHPKGSSSASHSAMEDPVLALAMEPTIQRYTPEDDIASIPSSYRKLRKSKSMFTTSHQPDTGHRSLISQKYRKWTGTKTSKYNALNKENSITPRDEPLNLRAPKSMSFLRSRQELPVIQPTSRAQNDLAVQLARDTFRQQVEQQSRSKPHPSEFFRSKTRRMDGSFGIRRSLRNSSNSSGPLPFSPSGETLVVPKQGALRNTARKVSKSLKSKIKGFFNRKSSQGDATSQEEGEEPASSQHSEDDVSHHIEGARLNEKASMSQGASRIASLHAIPSSQHIRSCRVSIESCDWEETASVEEKSRVTSWTDSLTNTLGSQSGFGDREWKRLSVIKENGLHASPMQPNAFSQSQSSDGEVYCHHTYSGLTTRENVSKEDENGTQKHESGHMRSFRKAQSRSGSVDQLGACGWSPPTIRCVSTGDDDVFQDKSRATKNSHIPGVSETASEPSGPSGTELEAHKLDGENKYAQPDHSEKAFSTTSRDGGSCRRKMVDRSSAFFASPSSHLFRTTSPFRRALRENMCAAKRSAECRSTTSTDYLDSLSKFTLPPRQPSSRGSPTLEHREDTESIYSPDGADGSENHWKRDESLSAFPNPPSSRNVCGQNGFSNFASLTEDPWTCKGQREVSGVSSIEWKASLSADIARLETIPAALATTLQAAPVVPVLGNHVREMAQIECSPDFGCSSPIEPSKGATNEASDPEFSTPSHERGPPIKKTSPGAAKEQLLENEQPNPRANSNQLVHGSSPSQRDQLYMKRRQRNRLAKDSDLSTKSSPGLTRAVERQFGKIVTGSPRP